MVEGLTPVHSYSTSYTYLAQFRCSLLLLQTATRTDGLVVEIDMERSDLPTNVNIIPVDEQDRPQTVEF